MKKKEYLNNIRDLLKLLTDEELGIYALLTIGKLGNKDPYAHVTNTELNNFLFPEVLHGEYDQYNYHKPTIGFIKKKIERCTFEFSSKRSKEKFNSLLISIGQKTHALLQNDKTEIDNLLCERIKYYEKILENSTKDLILLEKTIDEKKEQIRRIKESIHNLNLQRIGDKDENTR